MAVTAACHWSSEAEVKTLVLSERFDYESIHSFHRFIRKARPEDKIIVDMGSTRYIDSCGLGLLIGLERAMGARHEPISLVNCSPAIKRILLTCHLERRFDIH